MFSPVLRLWHVCNTGRYIGIVTRFLLMQLIGLTDQCNNSYFVFLSLIMGDNFGDPKCFGDEERVVEESTLLTTAVQPQPVKILLFSARSTGSIHTTEERYTCVKIWSKFRCSCVICGQRSTDLPCE